MSARTSVARMLAGPEEWNRRRLQLLLVVAVLVVIAVVAGIVWSVIELLGAGATPHSPSAESGTAARDSAAARATSIDEARPGPLSTGHTGTIRIPQPSKLGGAQVGTGFPPTAEGALAQLIAIDRRAIESAICGHRAGRDRGVGSARRPICGELVRCRRRPDAAGGGRSSGERVHGSCDSARAVDGPGSGHGHRDGDRLRRLHPHCKQSRAISPTALLQPTAST